MGVEGTAEALAAVSATTMAAASAAMAAMAGLGYLAGVDLERGWAAARVKAAAPRAKAAKGRARVGEWVRGFAHACAPAWVGLWMSGVLEGSCDRQR